MSDIARVDFHHLQFTVPEAARHMRISTGYFYKLVKRGVLKPTKLGTRTIVSGAEIDRALTALAEASTKHWAAR